MYDSGRTQGRTDVINGATGGIAYDGDDYIWSWASYGGKTFATASKYITLPSTTGTVYLASKYYDYLDATYYWPVCTHCGRGSGGVWKYN